MTTETFDNFKSASIAEGFDEVLARDWPPDCQLETHTHPFTLRAMVVRGEMWLTVDDQTRHLQPGDLFSLDRDVPHAERYGHEGATYWVARKN